MHLCLLVFTTFIWGLGFVGTRWTFDIYDPYWSHAWRFIIAGAIISPYLFIKRKEIIWKPAIMISTLLFLALLIQTIGIKYTTLAKSGFLTAFYAVFTPLFLGLLYKKRFSWKYWCLVVLSMLGMALLCELKIENFNYGDMFILMSAVLFSLHIIIIEKYAHEFSPMVLNSLQCFLTGILGLITALVISGPSSPSYFILGSKDFIPSVFLGFIILSIFSSIIAYSIQIFVQKFIQSHIVGVVFLMEAIFAAILGYIFFNESLNQVQIFGALVICISLVLLNNLNRQEQESTQK